MIFGIGTDIVKIKRIQASLQRFGERFAKRILTPAELSLYLTKSKQAHFLAKRFAVKEAWVKAIGLGMRQGLSFQDIEVQNNCLGRPNIKYSGRALALIQQYQISRSHISIADEQEFAVAYVVLET